MLNNNRSIYYFFLFSILLFIIGISFIIDSNKNILLFKDNFSNQKTTKLTSRFNAQEDFLIFDNDFSNQKIKKLAPRFIFREDLSIKNLSINNNLDKDIIKDNQSADQSINLNNFALKTVIVNNGTSLPYLQKLPNELDTIKDIKIENVV